MLQALTAATAAQYWAIASMFLFMTVFAGVVLLALGKRREQLERYARLPLDDAPPAPDGETDAGSPGCRGA